MYEILYRRAHEAVDESTPATPGPQQPPFATERDFVEVRLMPYALALALFSDQGPKRVDRGPIIRRAMRPCASTPVSYLTLGLGFVRRLSKALWTLKARDCSIGVSNIGGGDGGGSRRQRY